MKRIFLTSLLMISGFSAFGAIKVITITNQPIVLERSGGYYVVSRDYVHPKSGYTYVTLNGKNRVCYTKRQPKLRAGMVEIKLEIKNQPGVNPRWYCYKAVRPYFVVP